MNTIAKYLLFGFLILTFSCGKADKNIKPIIINTILNPKLEADFRKMDLKTIYPKLLTPENYDAERDTVLTKKILTFQKNLVDGMNSEKINWNVNESEISIFTRIYFDSIGRIEYFAFKINNDDVKLKAVEEFKNLLEKNIKDKSLGIERNTKYNYCVNFELPVEKE
ncbi:hypothetical protein [Yeosuana marina]|uniref:hypothetical protein n=1 Tax=Yeosuana marina TaxID=1565536 RepID=UPI0030EED50B|tara:strand:+ start:1571 stop:2071 length:501 start_codon:yes stop_codon:yes gene_type:complete